MHRRCFISLVMSLRFHRGHASRSWARGNPAVMACGAPVPSRAAWRIMGWSESFSLPIFSRPVDATELTTLLQVGPKGWTCGKDLRSGIKIVFESSRFEFGQGYAVLRPAHPVRASTAN